MDDGVKFIFKTLIKVPVIIVASFLVFNLFSFTVSYFRLYSVAQMINSIVMENNFVPGNEGDVDTMKGKIREYLDNNVTTNLLKNVEYNVDTGGGIDDRVQYGNNAKVTVSADFVWLIPLINEPGRGSPGMRGGYAANTYDVETELARRGFKGTEEDNVASSEIKFEYEVPCMKYYPDLEE